MNNVNRQTIKCQYGWQVKELERLHPGNTRLVAWPYSVHTNTYVVIVTTEE
jgi:hypothetical protein